MCGDCFLRQEGSLGKTIGVWKTKRVAPTKSSRCQLKLFFFSFLFLFSVFAPSPPAYKAPFWTAAPLVSSLFFRFSFVPGSCTPLDQDVVGSDKNHINARQVLIFEVQDLTSKSLLPVNSPAQPSQGFFLRRSDGCFTMHIVIWGICQ